VALCGVLTGITRKRNREGKPWAAMMIEDRNGSVEALVFAGSFERLAPLVVEDQAVVVRGLALPEESGPPKISVQEIVALDNARVDLPTVISIRVWLGRNGSVDKAQALEELFRRKPGETQVRLRLEAPRDFRCCWTCRRKCDRTGNSGRRWRKSAGRKRLNGWRDRAQASPPA
jgi:DNA polymerase-3 subunit alpha